MQSVSAMMGGKRGSVGIQRKGGKAEGGTSHRRLLRGGDFFAGLWWMKRS